MHEVTEAEWRGNERKFVRRLAMVAAFLAVLPAIIAVLATPSGSSYVGYQYNTDDHMVYAAWMRQAMDGHFLFDNRFTTLPQPGLTIHIYFFLLGLVAKITGIALATTLARVGFSVLFVWLTYRLVRRLDWEIYATKLALTLTIVGGGLGFLVWHSFGQDIVVRTTQSALITWATDKLPTDVWQPEGFVFPSMLTNSLFMVSLCLILFAFDAFLRAREDKTAILPGALALGVLMNIHSYDALLIGLVLVGFVAATFMQKKLTAAWVGRAALIALGMVPAALWFVHVLQKDPVFQSRAATLTYAPNFRTVVFGYLPLMALAFLGAITNGDILSGAKRNPRSASLDPDLEPGDPPKTMELRRKVGIALAAVLIVGLFAAAGRTSDGYFLSAPVFAGCYLVAIAAVALASCENLTWNLLFAWAVIGTIAMYFPGLFQRKLGMGLSIPWAILGAYGLSGILRSQERGARNLILALSTILLGASSILWLVREVEFVRWDVANTLRHPVFLKPDVRQILAYLNELPERKVVLCLPGAGTQDVDPQSEKPIPDRYVSPIIPDLAPFCSGLTGAYTYAGHWSETPNYDRCCGDMYRYFLREPTGVVRRVMTDEERIEFVESVRADYAILPVQESYPSLPLVTPAQIGEVVVKGTQFELIKLRR